MSARCIACGRVLTNPESARDGLGPVCRARRETAIAATQARLPSGVPA